METQIMKKTSDAVDGSSGGFGVDLIYVRKPEQSLRFNPSLFWTVVLIEFLLAFAKDNL